jgi:AAA15 family ATPase/GTPase
MDEVVFYNKDMRLKTLFIRFYKSFNYDYLERYAENPRQPQPWEWVDGEQEKWYPYVQIPIDPKVTTIVGANESGKTHLLDAIKKGISGQGISYEDFCRYSQFFAVTQGKLRLPDFGYEWADLSDQEKQKVKQSSAIEQEFERFLVFRSNGDNLTIYIPGENQQYDSYVVNSAHVKPFTKFLPNILPIKASIALPDSVPIEEILSGLLGSWS